MADGRWQQLIRHDPQPGSGDGLVDPNAGCCQNQGADDVDESHPVPTRRVAAGFRCPLRQRGAVRRGTQSAALARWISVRCPRCDCAEHIVGGHGARRLFQCQSCRQQTSLTAGTVLDSTKLPLCSGFLAIYRISQDKTGLSSPALMRHLGTSYRSAGLVHHKLMAAMAERDALEPLAGHVQLDDAQHGGERPGVAGRGSPNKVPIVAAVPTCAR